MSETDWDGTDEIGEPVHVRMGLTADGQGPADPPDPAFDHWGCWCIDPACPGPPPKHDTVAHILAGGWGIAAEGCRACEISDDPPPCA